MKKSIWQLRNNLIGNLSSYVIFAPNHNHEQRCIATVTFRRPRTEIGNIHCYLDIKDTELVRSVYRGWYHRDETKSFLLALEAHKQTYKGMGRYWEIYESMENMTNPPTEHWTMAINHHPKLRVTRIF